MAGQIRVSYMDENDSGMLSEEGAEAIDVTELQIC